MGDKEREIEERVGHGACVVPNSVLLYVSYTKYLPFGVANCAVHLMGLLVSVGRLFLNSKTQKTTTGDTAEARRLKKKKTHIFASKL